MSLQGSPYSNTYNQDDFDFNDDRYEDGEEDRENEEQPQQQHHPDESDEG